MKAKIDLGAKVQRSKTLTVKAEPLVIDLDVSPKVVAEAMKADLRQQIESQPGEKWDRSGVLKNGLTVSADGTEVRAPEGRLERADIRERFAAEVMAEDPLRTPAAEKAIGVLLGTMLGEKP